MSFYKAIERIWGQRIGFVRPEEVNVAQGLCDIFTRKTSVFSSNIFNIICVKLKLATSLIGWIKLICHKFR